MTNECLEINCQYAIVKFNIKYQKCCADRNQGIEYAEELEAACRQIKSYVNNLETEMKERAALVELLEQSQLYYDAQSSEANVVAMVSSCSVIFIIEVNKLFVSTPVKL